MCLKSYSRAKPKAMSCVYNSVCWYLFRWYQFMATTQDPPCNLPQCKNNRNAKEWETIRVPLLYPGACTSVWLLPLVSVVRRKGCSLYRISFPE